MVINYGKPAGAQFPQTTITPRRRPSPLTESQDEASTMLESIPVYDEVFETARKTPEEIQAMLDEYLLGEEDAEDTSTESTKYSANQAASPVDQAFEELLGA